MARTPLRVSLHALHFSKTQRYYLKRKGERLMLIQPKFPSKTSTLQKQVGDLNNNVGLYCLIKRQIFAP